MADPIEDTLRQLKRNHFVAKTRFNRNFLNKVGDILGRYGFGTAKTVLLEHLQRDEAQQARVLLNHVLPQLERCPEVRQNPGIGRFIIKTLIVLQKEEV